MFEYTVQHFPLEYIFWPLPYFYEKTVKNSEGRMGEKGRKEEKGKREEGKGRKEGNSNSLI